MLKEKEDMQKLRLQNFRSDIDEGLKQLDSGEFETHDAISLKKLMDQTKLRGRKTLSEKKAKVA